MHVRHRDDRTPADLKGALRAAEAAVKEKLDYAIALTEKELFDNSNANAGASSSTLGLARMCGNKRPLSEIDDNDPELNAALARAEAGPRS